MNISFRAGKVPTRTIWILICPSRLKWWEIEIVKYYPDFEKLLVQSIDVSMYTW